MIIRALKKLLFCGYILVSILAPCGASNIYQHTLDNGLKIIYIPTDSNGTFCFGILYNVGGAYDPTGKAGLSHFLEHMMFRGTVNLSGAQLKKLLDIYDSKYNAFTSYDRTFYYHIVKQEFLGTDLAIEADRMQNLKFDNDDFFKERDVVSEERKLTCEANIINKYVQDAIFKMLFMYSPYQNPLGGFTWQIKNYDRQSLFSHYKKYYMPNNATVIIVGSKYKDNEKDWSYIKSEVIKYFGRLKNQAAMPPRYDGIGDPTDTGLKYVLEKSIPEIKQSEENIIYSLDAKHIKSLKAFCTLQLLLDMLFGSSVMERVIIDEQELAYSINSNLWMLTNATKAFVVIEIALKKDIERHKVEAAFFAIITNFKNKYLTDELINITKKKFIDRYDLAFDSPEKVFSRFVEYLSNEFSVDDIARLKEIINDITKEDVIEMYNKVFNDSNLTHKIYLHPTNIEPNMVKNS